MTRAGFNARRVRAPLRRVALPLGVTGCLSDAPAAAHWQAPGGGPFLCGRSDERAVPTPMPIGQDDGRRPCRGCAREKARYDEEVAKDPAEDRTSISERDDGGDWTGLAWPDTPSEPTRREPRRRR